MERLECQECRRGIAAWIRHQPGAANAQPRGAAFEVAALGQARRSAGRGVVLGTRRVEVARWRQRTRRCYELTSTGGRQGRGCVSRQISGRDADLPPARGQTYTIPAGAFFTLRDGRIARVTTCYNLADWSAQVGAEA